MFAQGSAVINIKYYDDLADEISRINVCADLQAIEARIVADIQAQIDSISAQITALLPLIAIPTSLQAVIQWISNLVGFFLLEYEAAINAITAIIAATAKITAALEAALANIENCHLPTPTFTPPAVYVQAITPTVVVTP